MTGGVKGAIRGPYKIRDGQKWCSGPTHEDGGAWVPLTNFPPYIERHRRRKRGNPKGHAYYISRCKDCQAFVRAKVYRGPGGHGYMKVEPFLPLIRKLVEHHKTLKAASQAVGCHPDSLRMKLQGRETRIQKRLADKLVAATREMWM